MHISRILIVDDSPIARLQIKKCLGEGFEIYEASTGEEGFDLFQTVNIDLVFLDLIMPGMGGFETLKEMLRFNPEAPIAVISADRQESTIKKCVKVGASIVLGKPPREENLQKAIHALETGENPLNEGFTDG
jgi:CheY-like chemotaxis protein